LIVEFLNERLVPTEVLALELRRYDGQGLTTHIPRLLGVTSDAQLIKHGGGNGTGGRNSFTSPTL
jgi:hypothetical protein